MVEKGKAMQEERGKRCKEEKTMKQRQIGKRQEQIGNENIDAQDKDEGREE
jgi:hypothetical protein